MPAAATPAAQATPTAAVLHVRVVNLRNSTGQVICTLFDTPGAFPSDSSKAVGQIAVPIKDEAAVCSFGGLAPGTYALVTFHDENSNGKFDRNWLGLPKEGLRLLEQRQAGVRAAVLQGRGVRLRGRRPMADGHDALLARRRLRIRSRKAKARGSLSCRGLSAI